MIVKLIDGQEFVVNHERAAAIAKALGKPNTLIRLGDGIVKAHQVVSIMPGGLDEPDRTHVQIEAPKQPPIQGSLKSKLEQNNPQLFKKLYG